MRVAVLALFVAIACRNAPTPIATPVATAPVAPENCYAAPGNICMTVSNVAITCVDVAPGAGMQCKANIQMTIPTLVTTGRVSVSVAINATDRILATVENVPKTAPGVLTAPMPSQTVGGDCITGASNRVVEVYDGNRPSLTANTGRPLFVESAPTNMSCTSVIASR